MSQTLPVNVYLFDVNLTPNEIFVKSYLDLISNNNIVICHQIEISEYLNLDPPYVCRLLNSLMKKGWLKLIEKGNNHQPAKYKLSNPQL